jgi:integrase
VSTRSPDQKVKITKTVVDKLTPPASGQAFVRDLELKGFGARITASGVLSFIVEKRVNGRVRRMTLGRYGELTVEQARKRAQAVLGQVALGADPVAEKRRARNQGVSLAEAYADFLKARKELKEHTRYDYDRLFAVAFGDWQKKRLLEITRTMVATRHAQLGEQRGESYANLAMRFLRALFNFAIPTYDDGTGKPLLPDNPVAVLTQTRAWFRNERRQTVIKVHQLPAWFKAVTTLRTGTDTSGTSPALVLPVTVTGEGTSPLLSVTVTGTSSELVPPVTDTDTDTDKGPDMSRVIGDYLLFLLFTGLRRQEAATLKWAHVDLLDRTLRIPDPKNREPLILPLSDYLLELLQGRKELAVNEYVFPDRDGKKHLVEPKRQIQKVIEASEVPFTLHDLRRTFITVAESLDIPPYAIKRLVNHKMRGDVTAGYIVSDVERLRGPMTKITEFLLRAAKSDATTNVISLESASRRATQN